MTGKPELYRQRSLTARQAEVVARFLHPVTDAPMVTWYQTCPAFEEEPNFYSLSEKEFKEAFELKD